jgi:hypothetical protein
MLIVKVFFSIQDVRASFSAWVPRILIKNKGKEKGLVVNEASEKLHCCYLLRDP